MSTAQLVLVLCGIAVLAYPPALKAWMWIRSRIPGIGGFAPLPNPSPGPGPADDTADLIDMLIDLRAVMTDNESRDVIDEVLVPAAVRMLSEGDGE